MTEIKSTCKSKVSDAELVSVFKKSPLSRRTIRRRLGPLSRRLLSALLFSAVKRGVLQEVQPSEVGSNKYHLSLYKLKD